MKIKAHATIVIIGRRSNCKDRRSFCKDGRRTHTHRHTHTDCMGIGRTDQRDFQLLADGTCSGRIAQKKTITETNSAEERRDKFGDGRGDEFWK